jgi:hypothetical protein
MQYFETHNPAVSQSGFNTQKDAYFAGNVSFAGTVTGGAFVTLGRTAANYIVEVGNVTADIQLLAAVNVVAAAGGGIVFLKVLGPLSSDKYRMSATVPIPEGVVLVGEKFAKGGTNGVTIKTAAGVTLTDMFTITGSSNPTITTDLAQDTGFYGLTLDGNGTTTNLIKRTNADYTIVENCRLIEATNSIVNVWDSSSDPVSATYPGGLYVHRTLISCGTGGIGIDSQYDTQVWLYFNWFSKKSGTTPTAHVNIKAGNKIKIIGNEFNTIDTCIRLQDSATLFSNDLIINDNIFEPGSGARAVKEERTHASSKYVSFVGNVVGSGVICDTFANDQNVIVSTAGIGYGGALNSKAVLDLQSTTKGMLPPRMTTTQRDAISAPPEGLMIYNLTTHKLNVFTTAWEAVTSA